MTMMFAQLPQAASAPEIPGILPIVVNATAVIGKRVAAVTGAPNFRTGVQKRGKPVANSVILETPPVVEAPGIP